MYFSVVEPSVTETPLVVEVPHAGLDLDPIALATLLAPASCLARDADLYVDELYRDAPSLGATLLVAHLSRYVCDLNRGPSDVDALTVEGATGRALPHGVIWRSTTDGTAALRGPLSRSELERRLDTIYRPYHATLAALLERKRARFGFAVLLCGHSMPGEARASGTGNNERRADVVPGSRGFTSAAPLVVETPARLAQQHGWTSAHDAPYRGGFSTGHYGRPSEGVHAVQVELARRLYMDEHTLRRDARGFARTREYCQRLVEALGKLRLAEPAVPAGRAASRPPPAR